ncbi:MAG: thiamine pyrophosphate-binding protein, partial [Deltaproteobacteria bacterium]|nr:thiamine pyrophosphate-binding protein [Deltaproteobacteria bacterium]
MTRYEVTRYDCLEVLAPLVGDALVVIPPGGIENEWFALRPGPANLRLAMGEVTPLCLGLALALPRRRVVAIDADGSVLINLGAICTVGLLKPPNLKVV